MDDIYNNAMSMSSPIEGSNLIDRQLGIFTFVFSNFVFTYIRTKISNSEILVFILFLLLLIWYFIDMLFRTILTKKIENKKIDESKKKWYTILLKILNFITLLFAFLFLQFFTFLFFDNNFFMATFSVLESILFMDVVLSTAFWLLT